MPPSSARFAGLCALGFVITFGYSIAGRACRSLFLDVLGSDALPWAWIGVAATALVVVTIYNRFSASAPLARLFLVIAGLSAASLMALLGLRDLAPRPATYALEVWKDVHIVVLVELFWSFANAVYPIRTARWAYGFFLCSGALGAILGNQAVAELAPRLGTATTLWLNVPTFIIVGVGSWLLLRSADTELAHERAAAPARLSEGFRRVSTNRYLALILGLVVTVQFVITLIDYLYSVGLQRAYPVVDARTAIDARVHMFIDAGQLTLQVMSGPILRVAGVTATLMLVPASLALTLGVYAAAPAFLTLSVVKVASKALDYSLFRAAKELLYIPLDYADKTQGKGVIDMLGYRAAKGAVSVLLLFALQAGPLSVALGLVSLLIVVWMALALLAARRFHRLEDAL